MRAPLILSLVFAFLVLPACGDAGGGGDDGGTPDGSVIPDGGEPDAGDGGDGGLPDRPPPRLVNLNNDALDTDCDGLSDAEEFAKVYAGGAATDPADPDSDGDGIPDGVEAGRTESVDPFCDGYFVGDADPATTTSPVRPDTDADGIDDGLEDADLNGRVDPGETDPNDPDSDGDGLPDGCEDANGNGQVDPGETDAAARDSDQDGIADGIEDADHSCSFDAGETDPTRRDTDGDGASDGSEDRNRNGQVDPGETDPRVADADGDGDGIPDGIERDVTGTDPTRADTDGDGLTDGQEDKDQDGQVDAGETNPLSADTDCDGVSDGDEAGLGTDPRDPDSDGDGLTDGLEVGRTASPEATCDFVGDADPATTTDPTDPDSDGDGLLDGAEDRNHNGRVDPATADTPAEPDPTNGSDGDALLRAACATENLIPLAFHLALQGDVQVATRTAFNDTTVFRTPEGDLGVGAWQATDRLGVMALGTGATGAAVEDDEQAALGAFRSAGTVEGLIRSSFTTWDGYPAVRGTFLWRTGRDLKAATNAFAQAVSPGVTGLWSSDAGVAAPHRVAFSVVRRSPNRAVVVLALAADAGFSDASAIALSDLAGGSALAQAPDRTGVGCDAFTAAGNEQVDFLYVIDNSGSMSEEQSALQAAVSATVAQLDNSTLDWRVGVIGTDYYDAARRSFAGFTTDTATFEARAAIGTDGSGVERGLDSAQTFIETVGTTTGTDAQALRVGAKVVVVILSDEDESVGNAGTESDAISESAAIALADWFGARDVSVNGLICPPGQDNPACRGAGQDGADRYALVIDRLGGVRGNVEELTNIEATIGQIVSAAGAAASTYVLSAAPIGTTLKVALDRDGTVVTVPRDRLDGFDFDSARGSLQFFGDYRPAVGQRLAVSYRSWVDRSPEGEPCGGCEAPFVCNVESDQCECPEDCGYLPEGGYTCDPTTCEPSCAADCNGQCSGYETCNQDTCACECVQNLTCGEGLRFDGAACGCVCDTAQLTCEGNLVPDEASCACVCPTDCGGTCGGGEICLTSTCDCIRPGGA